MKMLAFLSFAVSITSYTFALDTIISLSQKVDVEVFTKGIKNKAEKEKLSHELLSKLLKEKTYAVVKFFSHTCPPCKRIAPLYEKLARQYNNDISFIEIDSSAHFNLTQHFRIMGNPTFITFKNGAELERIVGAREDELKEKIYNAVKLAKSHSPQPTLLLAQK